MDSATRKLVLWWCVLVALTVFSFESSWLGDAEIISVGIVILIALLKVRVVILHFMEVDHAPWRLRLPLELWVVAITIAILTGWVVFAA